jgi:hypothetical protein
MNNTKYQFIDESGLVGHINSTVSFGTGHIVDWDPAPAPDVYATSVHQTPCNTWTLSGLQMLAEMASDSCVYLKSAGF